MVRDKAARDGVLNVLKLGDDAQAPVARKLGGERQRATLVVRDLHRFHSPAAAQVKPIAVHGTEEPQRPLADERGPP